MKPSDLFLKDLALNVETHLSLERLSPHIDKAIQLIHKKIKLGGKLMLCGNGGSAADAQHLSAEYLIRLRPNINRKPLPAITLAQDTSTLTACGNDYSFSKIFKRHPGDTTGVPRRQRRSTRRRTRRTQLPGKQPAAK